MRREKEKGAPSRSGPIDWPDVYRRIEASSKTAAGEEDREAREKALASRAAALAAELEKKEAPGTAVEIVEFVLSYERYGMESAYIREICPLNDLTPVPCTPRFVIGIINVRGQILSVIDIKRLFGLPEKGIGDLNKVIILSSGDMEFGVLADSITGVRNVRLSALEAELPTLTDIRLEYLKGVTGDRVAVLDAGRLLADKAIVVNETVEI